MKSGHSTQAAANELRRSAYLAALGIDAYVSRTQLPGAAVTRRLAPVPAPQGSESVLPQPPPALAAAVTAVRQDPANGDAASRRKVRGGSPAAVRAAADRFSLVAIVSGGLIWLEELQGIPLATEQVQLVAAMAAAVSSGGAGPAPEVTQFNWPIHSNDQLDQGPTAARAALQGFVSRKLEQYQCRGVVLLGAPAADRYPAQELAELDSCQLPTTLAMLQEPALKKSAWAALQGMMARGS